MTSTQERPLEPSPSSPTVKPTVTRPPALDDLTTSTLSNSSQSSGTSVATDSTYGGRPHTPTSLPGTPGTPSSLTLRDLEIEIASGDDDQSEADSASATGTVAPINNAALRQKYHRHISRSAAKRDSVASLPSIQNLRLHFASGGRTEYRAGHGAGIRFGGLGATPEDGDEGTSIGLGVPPLRQPWRNVRLTRVAPAQARAEASELAAVVRKRWGVEHGVPNSATPPPETSADVRAVFIETARAVRRVRTLGLSLVPPGVGHRRVSGPPKNGPAFSTPSRPAQPLPRSISATSSATVTTVDPTMPVRRAAIELLGNLRTFEERVRVVADAPMVVVDDADEGALVASPIDEAPPAWPDRPSSVSPPPDIRRLSLSVARLSTSSLDDSLYSEDEDWTINDLAREAEHKERPHEPWEDRLVIEDRSYKVLDGTQWAADSSLIRDAARRWADAVDKVFGERGNSGPAVSWVSSGDSDIERARAFLATHLEPEHATLLPTSDDDLFNRLSDGYLLVQAYNILVHTSHRQWGFIPEEDVHDTVRNPTLTPPPPPPSDTPDAAEATKEAKDAKEWTFRRVANLTAWAAAIRLRYNLPIVLPHSAVLAPPTLPDGKPIPRAAPVMATKKKDAPRIDFDPLLVAKRDPEGERMLRSLLFVWVAEAAREVTATGSDADKEKDEAGGKEADEKEQP